MKKILVIISLLLFLGGGGFFLVKQVLRDPSRLPIDLPTIAKYLEFELENVRYGHTRAGVKKWDLSTQKARRIKGQDEIQLEGVKARIYAEGKLESDTQIEADRGSYVVESGDMLLEGQVKITNPQFEIVTGSLRYQEAAGEIVAPESLVVNSEKLKIEAARATIDIERQQLHFRGGVRARISFTAGQSEVVVPPRIEVKSEEKSKNNESSPKSEIQPVLVKKAKPVLGKIYAKNKPIVEIGKRE